MRNYLGWRKRHYEVIAGFLNYLNTVSCSYVLKGGTSLMMCYGLTRFSEDIYLDGFSGDIGEIVKSFCKTNNFKYRTAKNTDTVKRFMIDYGNSSKPLKIEVSYRLTSINFESVTTYINCILVYQIRNVLIMKLSAYSGRDKIRDLYDVVFIGLNYWQQLGDALRFQMRDIISYKGIEQFDFVIKDQKDELINNDELAEGFLRLWSMLGLR